MTEGRNDTTLTPDFVRGMIFRLKTGDLDPYLLAATAEVLRRLLAENELLRDVLRAADDLQAVGIPLNTQERNEFNSRRGHLLGRLEKFAEASRGT